MRWNLAFILAILVSLMFTGNLVAQEDVLDEPDKTENADNQDDFSDIDDDMNEESAVEIEDAAPLLPDVQEEAAPEEDMRGKFKRINVVQKKVYTTDGKHEIIAPLGGLTINNRYHSHYNVGLQYVYHINENFGISIGFAKAFGSQTSVQPSLSRIWLTAQIPDFRINYYGYGGMQFKPIYGKFEFQIPFLKSVLANYDIYLDAGIGMSGNDIITGEKGPDEPDETRMMPVGTFALGFRIFALKWLALKVEFRDIMYAGLANMQESKKDGVQKANTIPVTGVFNNMFLQFGIGYLF